MSKKLNILYRSQYDSDASLSLKDCGAACVAMLLEGFGTKVDIDDVFRATGRGSDEYLSRGDLISAAKVFNLETQRYNFGSHDFLIKSIDKNKPFIALIHYKAWSDRGREFTQSNFKGPHFVVVTGYDGNDVFIHDPLWWGHRRLEGEHKRMTYSQFNEAWATSSDFPGNPNFAGIIPKKGMPGLAQPVVPPVSDEVINRILAWAFMNGVPAVTADTLAKPGTVDVFLNFMNDWGKNVVEHEVKPEDDLSLIALHYYGDPMKWKVITLFNGLPPINAYKEGDVLKIPEPTNL